MKQNALIIGESLELACALPSMLFRSGFNVEMITINPIFKKSKFITDCEIISDRNLFAKQAGQRNLENYDLIVVTEDTTLKHILESDLTTQQKLKIIPVQKEENLQHIYSKIALSKILSTANVNTPAFEIANCFEEAINYANKLGYPVMIKIDASGGGSGVFECQNDNDFAALKKEIFKQPLLIQKKIIGTELGLPAFYRDGKLVHFSYAKIEKVINNKFGPSSLRNYQQLGTLDEQIFAEMSQLGAAIGANGFVNISCLQSGYDNKRYFIEADMRPDSWVEFTKFIGEDPAQRIAAWFKNQQTLHHPHSINPQYPTKLLLPYFLRMSLLEILFNRYLVWKFIPQDDWDFTWSLIKECVVPKKLKWLCRQIKRSPTTLIRLFVPNKDHRLKIRCYFYDNTKRLANLLPMRRIFAFVRVKN
ncbi:MAG: hypothetical protein V4612_04220 [Pseudomonadota bacterium]